MNLTMNSENPTGQMVGHRQPNLSKGEMEGVKWLQSQINQDKLAVVQADKGGAIILTKPQRKF